LLTKKRIIFEEFEQNKNFKNNIIKNIKNLSNNKYLFNKSMKIFPMKKGFKKSCQ
jgi:hypothetical protein